MNPHAYSAWTSYDSKDRLEVDLFWTVAVILVVLWLFGLIGGIGGGLINILVIVAIIVIAVRLLQGRNPISGR